MKEWKIVLFLHQLVMHGVNGWIGGWVKEGVNEQQKKWTVWMNKSVTEWHHFNNLINYNLIKNQIHII